MRQRKQQIGRFARGTVATLALIVNGGLATIALLWSCCGGLDLASNVSSPLFWGYLSGAAVALMSLPPISKMMRQGHRRWLAVPFLAGTVIFFCGSTDVYDALPPELGGWFFVVLTSTALCAIYVMIRVVANSSR